MKANVVVVGFFAAMVGSASAQTVLQSYSLPGWVSQVGDLDADGLDDLVAGSSVGLRLVSTATGAQMGFYAYPASSYGPVYWAFGDVNGDGSDDLAVIEMVNGAAVLRVLASPTGAVIHSKPVPYAYHYYVTCLDDLNGDGCAEFAVGNPFAPVNGVPDVGRLDVYDGATGVNYRTHWGTTPAIVFGKVYSVGDVNGDGVGDYSIGGWNSQAEAYSGATGAVLFPMHPWAMDGVALLGDLDADGRDEYSVNSPYFKGATSTTSVVCSGNGGGVLQSFTYTYGGTGMAYPVAVGDIDGDGHDDICLQANLGSGSHSRILSGRAWNLLGTHTPAAIGGSPGDWNADGVPDLWVVQSSSMRQLISGVRPGVSVIGSGCPDGANVTPRIGVGLGAKLGHTMTVNLSNAAPGLAGAVLVLGYGNQSWNGVALPVDLAAIGMPGCLWHVEGASQLLLPTQGMSGTRRRATYPIAVPNNPQLIGLALFGQWVVFDPPTSGLSGAVTRAVRFQVVP